MQNLKLRRFVSYLLFSVFLTSPNFAGAESLNLKTAKSTYRVGDSFEVSVSVDAGTNSINTLSGKIKIPTEFFQISNLRYGNSIVTLWVEKPSINQANGEISFTGGIPGGFTSGKGPILTFSLKAKKVGTASLTPEDASLLLNDGLGTALAGVATPSLKLTILEALPIEAPVPKTELQKPIVSEPKVEVYVPTIDKVAPEFFIPLISNHPTIADNKYFASFSAVDKDSGVKYYEVKEMPKFLTFWETDWTQADSLYVLKNQLWMTKVVVRAYDQEGNYTDGEATKSMDPVLAAVLSLAAGVLILCIIRLSTEKPIKAKKKMLK